MNALFNAISLNFTKLTKLQLVLQWETSLYICQGNYINFIKF